ncbi:MAG: hypothetical protein OEW02_10250, partial [Myxococcales bacterium]|nr:hypothetical protein [Myxococcales bacterium]
ALDLRDGGSGARRARALHEAVRKAAPMVAEDRRLDGDIARVLEMLRGDALPLGSYSSAR